MDDRHCKLRHLVACTLVLVATVVTDTRAADNAMTPLTHVVSAYGFSETLGKLRSALEAKGFTIFAIIDQREAARSVGLDMPPTTLLIYGNPEGGTPLMLAAPDFALELPLKVLVREEAGGQVLIVYSPASSLEGRHGLPAGLAGKLGGAEPLIAAAVGANPPTAH